MLSSHHSSIVASTLAHNPHESPASLPSTPIKRTSSITSSRGCGAGVSNRQNCHCLPDAAPSIRSVRAFDPSFHQPVSSRSASAASPDILAPAPGLSVHLHRTVAFPHPPIQRARSTLSSRASNRRFSPHHGSQSSRSAAASTPSPGLSNTTILSANDGAIGSNSHRVKKAASSGKLGKSAISLCSSARSTGQHKSRSQKQSSPATKTSRMSVHSPLAKSCRDLHFNTSSRGRQSVQNDWVGGWAASRGPQSLDGVHSAFTSHLSETPSQSRRSLLKTPVHQDFITPPHLMKVVDDVVEKYASTMVEHTFFPEVSQHRLKLVMIQSMTLIL